MSAADQMLAQLYADDELYCAKNLKIRTKKGDILPFVWNDAQRLLHERVEQQLAEKGWVRPCRPHCCASLNWSSS